MAVISRNKRITANTTADTASTTTDTKWACGNAVVAVRIFVVNGRPAVVAAVVVVVVVVYGGGGSVGDFCQGTLCQGVWYQVTDSPKRSRDEDQSIDK